MVDVYWTLEAKARLKDIYDYLAQQNKIAAKNVVKSIREKARLLKTFPKLGAVYSGMTSREVRVIYYTHYRIAYVIVSEERIDILGVFHGAMDMKNYLS